jgi:hypothetical protein
VVDDVVDTVGHVADTVDETLGLLP